MKYLQSLLDSIGINPDRVEMVNVSAAMASEFTQLAQAMVERLNDIGKSPLKNDPGS